MGATVRGRDTHTPSVRGWIFGPTLVELEQLVESGEARLDELSAALESADLALVGQKLEPDSWYPVASLGRIAAFLDRRCGRRRREDVIEQGRRRFAAVSGSGEYLELAPRVEDWGGRFGFFALTVWSSLYNFMRWRLEDASRPGVYVVHVREASALPEPERLRLQGFIEAHTAYATGGPAQVSAERPATSELHFHVIADRFRPRD